jgi:hypothetical protein
MRIRHTLIKPVRILLWAFAAAAVLGIRVPGVHGQARQVSLGVKYLNVADLQSSFAIEGAEFEMHRTGSGLGTDQIDGLRMPTQYRYQDVLCAKGMWIGTTNFADPVANTTFPYKVDCAGPRNAFPQTEIMPVTFRLVGRFNAPEVFVDGADASTIKLNDALDKIDESMPADRMIDHTLHTSIGVTVTRKALSFVQQNHGNYFIYEYKLKNTGIIDLKGAKLDPARKLTGIILFFQHRYAIGSEAFRLGFGVNAQISYGRNTINEVIGTNPAASDFKYRAIYSYYGSHSASASLNLDDFGAPNYLNGGLMAAARMVGIVTLHADKSATDKSDDLTQPKSTPFIGSDNGPNAPSQYDADLMSQKYVDYMAAGHPPKTHAQLVGNSYADQYGSDNGGYAQCQGYGPYDLSPGDSITIIQAEAVAGLSREKNIEVGRIWFDHWQKKTSDPMKMPDGSTTTDFNAYKNAWVWTAKDSLYKAFDMAMRNYKGGYKIPQPPPPPDKFMVTSGGDRIILNWSDNPKTAPHFNGYRVYRAVGKPDTMYKVIFECNASNAVSIFEDTTPQRGINHFYYVVSKDDGTQNDLQPGVPLESSKFYTMTATPAFLRRPAKNSLDEIVVVPNPYHINAANIQFGINQPDQISFFNLPPKCTIRIFTERGDLVKTLYHTNSSGDESWDSTTEYKQLVVSGLYIAHFEVTEDVVDKNTNQVIVSTGDKTYRKFIIIR